MCVGGTETPGVLYVGHVYAYPWEEPPGSGSPSLAPDNPTSHPSYSRTASRTFARMSALRASGKLSQLATISARSSESPYSSGTLPGCGDLCCLCPDVCGLCCGCSSCLVGREGKQIEEGVFAEMVLQHLRGFVQGVRGTFADLAGYVILDVSRRRSG